MDSKDMFKKQLYFLSIQVTLQKPLTNRATLYMKTSCDGIDDKIIQLNHISIQVQSFANIFLKRQRILNGVKSLYRHTILITEKLFKVPLQTTS